VTELLLGSAAPVFTLDGQVSADLARDVARLEVREDTAGLKTLTLRLVAFGPAPGSDEERLVYLDDRLLDFGRELAVSVGAAGADATVFRGAISAIEASFDDGREPEVVVYAEDRLMDLRTTRRMRAYERATDEQIAERIAADHGIRPEVAAPGPTYDVVQQWNQSDLAFLRERAARIGAEVWLGDGALHFQSRANRAAPALTLVQGNHLIACELRADLAHQRTRVVVSGYDAEGREAIHEEAGGEALLAESAGGLTGPAALRRAFGERTSYRTRDVPLTAPEARDWARSEMLRRGRGFVVAEGTTRGSPTLVVGSALRLERVGAPFEGNGYRATEVVHTFDLESGYRTRFRAERPDLNPPGAA
jgi:uncharacterized protein